ncbi:fatty acid transporter protein [Penicillium taxi]|uniref:fatty acid transporter protein n=1 Tax=Penicillium taxi TaxID=168475 RepID=UPI0025457516|nr:fatty acid transporter protein [Penicillium taxi]KAJ5895177.1 fatty acid transporter protein [Penicillium taxi]
MALAAPITAALGLLTLANYCDAKFHLRHDFRSIIRVNKPNALQYITGKLNENRLLMYHVLEDQANNSAIANNLFLIFPHDGRTWTYKQFFEDTNRVGNWLFQELGVKKGELVALDGLNSPEYLMAWFALDSIGAGLSGARYCLVDENIRHLVEPVERQVEKCTMIYYTPSSFASAPFPTTPPPPEQRSEISPDMIKTLLYTSGTTGLPKAVIKTVASEIYTGFWVANRLELKPENRFYTCLPLFHGAPHSLCVTPVLHTGCTIILGRKFSHSTFWKEVVENEADIIQYVGELCRYLLNGKPHPLERKHNIRMAWGNGMRQDVWEPFRQRFNIPVINELYAATDGIGISVNPNEGEFSRHAIDIRGLIWRLFKGSTEKIVKIDIDTQEIIRDPATGFAIPCRLGEAGETIHWLNIEAPKSQFSGYYQNSDATNKRFIRNVFKKGDMWFRSSDMMRHEESGCVYFVDRLGDTYRWKSENISTSEVSDIMGSFPQIKECNVYGVLVPNADGRAGCAAIVYPEGVTEGSFDFRGLAEHAIQALPRYAVPVFLRLVQELVYTETMKMQKGKLRLEGCDYEKVAAAGDKLYWLPPNGSVYVPFTQDHHEKLKSGEIRL